MIYVTIASGIIIIVAGIYYKANDLVDVSWRSPGKSFRSGEVILDGNGIIFLGLFILGLAWWFNKSLSKNHK